MHRFRHPIAFAFSCTLLVSTGPTAGFGQVDCTPYQSLAPLYFDYENLMEPDTPEQAKRIAQRLSLRIGHADSAGFLHEQGLRPSLAGAEAMAQSLDAMRDLAKLWMNDGRLTRSILRQNSREHARMGTALTGTDCFQDGATGAADKDFSNAPEKAKQMARLSALSNRSGLNALVPWADTPSAAGLIALFAAFLTSGAIGIWYGLHKRRVQENRGHRRSIFTHELVFLAGNERHRVRAADLGRGGTKIRRTDVLLGAKDLRLLVEGQEIPALVGWENAHFMGISFRSPISRKLLRSIQSQAVPQT